MAISASGYIFLATNLTSTTTATSVGAYTVPASTRSQIVAVTVSNMATTNAMAYADVAIYNGTASFNVGGRRVPIYPGGAFVAIGIEKHVLPTSGAIQVTSYSTTQVDVAATIVELAI